MTYDDINSLLDHDCVIDCIEDTPDGSAANYHWYNLMNFDRQSDFNDSFENFKKVIRRKIATLRKTS